MRLIDADALIGKFNAKYKANGSISKGTFAKIVNEVPTIESPRWTPCAEGMPTKVHALKNPEQCTFRARSVKDGHGDTERGNDWCNGYQKSEVDDEPCLTCQACKLCAANDQEED